MRATAWENLFAWLRLYLVGAWILLLQLLRGLRPPPHVPHPHLRGKTFVLTGASSGIGRALCNALLARGARVIALLSPSAALPAHSHRIDLHADLRDLAQVRAAAAAVPNHIPPGDRAILLHAAGTLAPARADECMLVNLIAPAVLSALLAQNASAAVFLGSAAALAADRPPPAPARVCRAPAAQRAAYPTAKALLPAAADAWARTVGRPAVVVHPGVVATPLYAEEAGVIGCALRRLLAAVAWRPETAAARVLEVMRRAGVLDGGGADAGVDCWDATTLARTTPPRAVRVDGGVCGGLRARMWAEVCEHANIRGDFTLEKPRLPLRAAGGQEAACGRGS